MADETLLKKYHNIETVELKGCNVELAMSQEAAGTVAIDPEQESGASEDQVAKKVVLTGYHGRVALSLRGHVEIYAQNSEIKGTLVDGHVVADGIDLKCEAPAEAVEGAAPSVPPVVVGWCIDAVGVAFATGFYVLIFALLSNVINFEPLDPNPLSWAIVLGAGTYFGYTGHSIASVVLAAIAVGWTMVLRAEGRTEPGMGRYVDFADFIKMGVFLGIMILGKLLRDYIDSYRRSGWAGLRNRMRK